MHEILCVNNRDVRNVEWFSTHIEDSSEYHEKVDEKRDWKEYYSCWEPKIEPPCSSMHYHANEEKWE